MATVISKTEIQAYKKSETIKKQPSFDNYILSAQAAGYNLELTANSYQPSAISYQP
ncbi:MAG: hypothetical protein ACJ75B_16690 [Flavisolibacter sp.]